MYVLLRNAGGSPLSSGLLRGGVAVGVRRTRFCAPNDMYIYIYIYIHTYTYIYIYVHMYMYM